jgi:protein-L-isoaspartate(D-aspartate) O-methyltransferase
MAERNLAAYGVDNVDVVLGYGASGWEGSGQFAAPYDVIIISGSLPVLPDAFLRQLKVGGRLLAVIGERPVMEAQLITRTSESGFNTRTLFETGVTPLRQAVHPSHFTF